MAASHYGLSEIEYDLMKMFWASDHPLPFAEVLNYCNNEKDYGWAQTTLHTYLTRLIRKGVLHSDRKGYKKSYRPELTEAELSHLYAGHFVEQSYGGSIKNLLVSLTYNTQLSREEVSELQKIREDNLNRDQQ